MANYLVQGESLKSVADAIRNKNGTTEDLVFPNGFVEAIDSIETSGGSDESTEMLKGLIDGTATHIKVPEGTTNIKHYAFYEDKTIQSIELPKSVTAINDHAFDNCNQLRNINISDVTELGTMSFKSCSHLELTSLPHKAMYIPEQCFCSSGVKIETIPKNIYVLENGCFIYCVNIKTITFMGSAYIDPSAFHNTNIQIINVPWSEGEIPGAPWGATSATINYNMNVGPKAVLPLGTYLFNEKITLPPSQMYFNFNYLEGERTGTSIALFPNAQMPNDPVNQWCLKYFRQDTSVWTSAYGYTTEKWYRSYEIPMRTITITAEQQLDTDWVAWFLENTTKIS